VKIRHRQEFTFSGFYPIVSVFTLTLGAMSIAATVVADGKVSTLITGINMSTQSGCSALF
jgi:hypothetical protein